MSQKNTKAYRSWRDVPEEVLKEIVPKSKAVPPAKLPILRKVVINNRTLCINREFENIDKDDQGLGLTMPSLFA
jgi:CRISPR/Cas system CSM-associated protein Csm5 (group 7 of RAMP superfamily)